MKIADLTKEETIEINGGVKRRDDFGAVVNAICGMVGGAAGFIAGFFAK